MKIQHYILILLIASLLGGCKREEIPTPISNVPIFGIEGSLGSDSISLIAGIDNVILAPSLLKANGVTIYSGKLSDDNTYFQLNIFNGNIDFPDQPRFDVSSINEIFLAPSNNGVLWYASKADFPNASSIVDLKWYLDGVESSTPNELSIYKPGRYQVCAKVVFEDASESTLCREITVGFRKNADFEMQYQVVSASNIEASVTSSQTISSINWFIDETLVSTDLSINVPLPTGKYLLRSEVKFDNGIVLNRATLVDVSWNGNGIADFSSFAVQTTDIWDNTAVLTIFKGGKAYTSDTELNAGKSIAVEEIKFYTNDANGIPIYILKGKVDAILKDSSNQNFPLKAKLAIGLSVK